MRPTNHQLASDINLFELGEAVSIFGIAQIKEALFRDAARVRELIVKSSSLSPEKFASELHKACGRLSLLGAHNPRHLSRQIRAKVLEASGDVSSSDLNKEMLAAVHVVENELVQKLEEFMIFENEKTAGFGLIGIIGLALFSYIGAAIGFLATLTFAGAAIGFGTAFLGTIAWAVIARCQLE